MTQTFKPTPNDIRAAITDAETDNWLDPSVTPICWSCDLYGPDGVHIGNGDADTAAATAAMDSLSYCAPDGLVAGYIDEHDNPVPLRGARRLPVSEGSRDLLEACMLAAFHGTFPKASLGGVVEAKMGKTWGELK